MRSAPVLEVGLPTLRNLRAAADRTLKSSGMTDTPTLDADLLLSHVVGFGRAQIHAHGTALLDAGRVREYARLVGRRATGEPVAYLLESAEFYGLPLRVTRDTLIPRPDTETIVEAARDTFREMPPDRIVDLGTGTGCIALALAHVFPEAKIWATDSTRGALAVAGENAERLGCTARVTVLEHRFGQPLPAEVLQPVDLVVSNPPYVTEEEWARVPASVRDFEPPKALLGGENGLMHYPGVIATATAALRVGGWLAVEIGATLADAVGRMLGGPTWGRVTVRRDLAGRERVVLARRES